jgi:hypothetical protein
MYTRLDRKGLITRQGNRQGYGNRKARRKARQRPDEYKRFRQNHPVWSSRPLWHYLRQSVGEFWNVIYRNLCERHPDPYDLFQIKEAVDWMVDRNCTETPDGRVLDTKGVDISRMEGFYVAQRGILCYIPKRKTLARKNRTEPRLVRREDRFYYKWRGIWYRVKVKELPNSDNDYKQFIVLGKDVFGYGTNAPVTINWLKGEFKRRYGEEVFCVDKQQISSREIKRERLK